MLKVPSPVGKMSPLSISRRPYRPLHLRGKIQHGEGSADQRDRDVRAGRAIAWCKLANADELARVGEETAVRFLYENMKGVYEYKSLFEFKRKYRPQWHGRYIAYHRGLYLPLVGLAVARVHTPGGVLKFLRAA